MKPCFRPPSRLLDREYKRMSYEQHVKELKSMKPTINTVSPPPTRQITWRKEMTRALEEQNATGNRHIREIMELGHLPKLRALPNVSRPVTSASNRSRSSNKTIQPQSGRLTRISAPTYMKTTSQSMPTSSRSKRSTSTRSDHSINKEQNHQKDEKPSTYMKTSLNQNYVDCPENTNITNKEEIHNNENNTNQIDNQSKNVQDDNNIQLAGISEEILNQNQIQNDYIRDIIGVVYPHMSRKFISKEVCEIDDGEEDNSDNGLTVTKKEENLGFFGSFRKELGDSLIHFIAPTSEPTTPANEPM